MRIAFIYESGFAGNNGSNHLLCTTIEKMLQRGHSVDLIEAVSVRDNPDYPPQLDQHNFQCHTIELKATKKTNFIGRYLYGLSFVRESTKLARDLDVDLFFVQSVPTVSFTIRRLKKYGKPIIYNIHDVFPGSAFELGVVKSKILDYILKRIQRIGFRLADKIVVVSDDMRDVLVKEKTDPNKLFIVNTWYDSDSIRYIAPDENTFVKEYDIDTSKLIIQYAGNVGQVFGMDEFVELVNALKDNKAVEFHIVGQGVKIEELKTRTQGSNIKFFGWQKQERMSEIYSYCDMEIIPLHHGVIGNNVPSKMALSLAVGKPVINIVEKSGYYMLFKDNHIGYSFSQNEINDAIDIINEISKDKSCLKAYREDTREFANRVYSKDKNNDRLLDMLEELQKGWKYKA